MKRSYLLILSSLGLLQTLLATDRVVSPNGLYNTITAAIGESADGDRILIAAATYPENIEVPKSLELLPLVEGTKYTISGSVRVSHATAPVRVTISGARLMLGVFTTGGPGRLDLRVIDSWSSGVSSQESTAHVELYRDSLPQGLGIASGSVVGNVIGDDPNWSNPLVQVVPGSVLTDPLHIIGNKMRLLSTTNPTYIIDSEAAVPFHIENNFIFNVSGSTQYVRIRGNPATAQSTSSIANNTFYRPTSSSIPTILGIPVISLVIKNNVTINDIGPHVDWTFSPTVIATHNLFAAPSWINTSTGQSLAGTPLIDAGDPDPRYLDLDLTTNDVGCYGGSNSRANFTTGMGSAVVGFMHVPRVVSQGDPVNISAIGFDR